MTEESYTTPLSINRRRHIEKRHIDSHIFLFFSAFVAFARLQRTNASEEGKKLL
jgi:hypothetical protein